ncbi:hypothetical protein BGZ63DRAFT_155981 [Mariannaea sp. PMI_226]|nr:hypothetical protein BGZ63DRAFT_155981 [Mariannaea sp. PMI_226]
MAGTEQNGIDILCDAAGSDMLLSSLFALASPAQDQNQQGQYLQQLQHDLQQQQQQPPPPAPPEPPQPASRSGSTSLPAKRKLSNASASSPSHVCHICRRVYERADHLTRHLRSHENARPYQCSRCPKRFNRADLLTRHETTHDRDGAAKDRPFIKRSDRAAEACLNCAASKAKCEDQKPCGRCRSKNLACQMPTRRSNQYRTSDSQPAMSPSETSTVISVIGMDNQGLATSDGKHLDKPSTVHSSAHDSRVDYQGSGFTSKPSMKTFPRDPMYFGPAHSIFQHVEFPWNIDLDSRFPIPRLDAAEPGAKSFKPVKAKRSPRRSGRDSSRNHTPFERSSWIYEPDLKDAGHIRGGTEISNFGDESPSFLPSSISEKSAGSANIRLQNQSLVRDRLFAMVLSHNQIAPRVPSFPSMELLSYLLQTHFVQDERKCDSLIHEASFDPGSATIELLAAIVSTGATYISVTIIWQFGLALNDVTGLAIASKVQASNSKARDLMTLQAMMLHLGIGQWSGFNRNMEVAETSALLLLTILRRSAGTSFSSDSPSLKPSATDSAEDLDSKWRQFIALESHKRLALRLFFHDIQSSIGLYKNPLMSFNELDFTAPASRDLWKARSATEWRDLSLSIRPTTQGRIPRMSELTQSTTILDELEGSIDVELSYTALLYGFWGQIWSYRDAVKFYNHGGHHRRNESRLPSWLRTQHQELYRGIAEFVNQLQDSRRAKPQLIFLAELFMMILHVPLDDLQKISEKNGEDEDRQALQYLEEVWFPGSDSRYAAWHAGQVFHWARKLPATSLHGFNAIAVYWASLTLWAYGLASRKKSLDSRKRDKDTREMAPTYVLVDGDESRESRAFLQFNRGIPGLTTNGDESAGVESLSNSDMILKITQHLLRENFPVRIDLMPPFVELLSNLLGNLGSGLGVEPHDE